MTTTTCVEDILIMNQYKNKLIFIYINRQTGCRQTGYSPSRVLAA